MQRKAVTMRRGKWFVVCLAAALIAGAVGVWWQFGEAWLAAYWEADLARSDDEDAARICERLAKLGRPGLAVLVRQLGNDDDQPTETAWLILDREIEQAGRLRALQASHRLTQLAEALADNVEQLSPEPQQRAARLAMKILLTQQGHDVIDGGRLAAACERTLQAARLSEAMAADTQEQVDLVKATAEPQTPVQQTKTTVIDHSMSLELAELKPPELARADRFGNAFDAPRMLGSFEGEALATAGDRLKTQSPAADAGEVVAAAYTVRRSADPSGEANAELRNMEPQKLFTLLNDRESSRASEIELDRRGYSARQIEISKHLTSPDAEERLRWTELLPGIRGIDARFWLLRLSDDVNLQVRRTAVGLLATDVDPEVMRRLRQIVIQESDDDIRNQAARALDMWESPDAP